MSLQSHTPTRRVPLNAARIAPERRRFKRYAVLLTGRFMRADKTEHGCKCIDLSPGGIHVATRVPVTLGERIVAQFEHVGGIVGTVVRVTPEGFALALSATRHKREKLAAQITWLVNRHDMTDPAKERQHERIAVGHRMTTLKLTDGFSIECRILDVSLSGASLGTAARPPIGDIVDVGKQRARVMRYHEHGLGVQFLEAQERDALQRDFG